MQIVPIRLHVRRCWQDRMFNHELRHWQCMYRVPDGPHLQRCCGHRMRFHTICDWQCVHRVPKGAHMRWHGRNHVCHNELCEQ